MLSTLSGSGSGASAVPKPAPEPRTQNGAGVPLRGLLKPSLAACALTPCYAYYRLFIHSEASDHFFGIKQLLQASPTARAVGTRGTVAAADGQGDPAFVDSFWGKLFPGEIPQPLAFPEELDGNAIELEGHRLEVVEAGFTDTADSAVGARSSSDARG